MNLNKAFILGNLTRDPEIRALPSGQSVAAFGVATNRFYTDKSGEKRQDAEFHNITAFGRLADISSRYLTKGSLVLIEGRLRTGSWQDSSGVKHFRTEIIAQNIQLAPKTMGKTIPGTPEETKEDIPIIEEENYTPPAPSSSSEEKSDKGEEKETKGSQPSAETPEEKKTSEDKDQDNEEINVKDIPF